MAKIIARPSLGCCSDGMPGARNCRCLHGEENSPDPDTESRPWIPSPPPLLSLLTLFSPTGSPEGTLRSAVWQAPARLPYARSPLWTQLPLGPRWAVPLPVFLPSPQPAKARLLLQGQDRALSQARPGQEASLWAPGSLGCTWLSCGPTVQMRILGVAGPTVNFL